MAGIMLHASSGEVQLAGTAVVKTMLQMTCAASDRVRIQGWGIAIKGTSATDAPILATVAYQSTAGTQGGANIAVISHKNQADLETLQTTVLSGPAAAAWTTEPTTGNAIENFEVHPQTGYRIFYPMGQEIMLTSGLAATVGRIGWRTLSPTVAYSSVVEVDAEE